MKRGQFNRLNPTHFDFGASLRKPFGESSFNRLIRQYKANAKRRGHPFELSVETLRKLTSSNCAYCGGEPSQRMSSRDANGHYLYNGIDRIDNSIGYINSNCVTSCKICNRAKRDMTEIEWVSYLQRLTTYQQKK